MNHLTFEWAVIGAGPAGIAAVGKLLDSGIDENAILWIDEAFLVGDFGTRWQYVPSNTKVKLFLKFFSACQSFAYDTNADFSIHQKSPEDNCLLSEAAEVLQSISDHLKLKTSSVLGKVQQLKLSNNRWEITLATDILYAKNIILATGSEQKSLPYANLTEISLTTALNPTSLQLTCKPNDKIAVFGSSHSAILVLKNLLESCEIAHVVNFYHSPLRFAIDLGDWTLFDNTGLKGAAAQFAKKHINENMPSNLTRVIASENNIQQHLSDCNKVVYAIGFEKRKIMIDDIPHLTYNENTGIIAPGLFGFGIGFPNIKTDKFGNREHQVGLWKFMQHLENVLPVWLKYGT